MQNSLSFWDVFQKYFSEGIILPLFAIALVVILREWDRKKVVTFISVVATSVLVLFNELTYRVLEIAGEKSTYYRFFWICPVILFVSYLSVKILFSVKSRNKATMVIIGCIMFYFFGAGVNQNWLLVPENIYQLDQNVIQVADAVMELTDGEATYFIDNGDLSKTIRQYDSRINFTEIEVVPLDLILRGYNTNVLGRDVINAIWNNRSRYIALKKEDTMVCKLVEGAGISLVSHTDNYNIYYVDYEQLYKDWIQCRKKGENIKQVNIEYVPIEGLQKEKTYIYISEFGVSEASRVYQELFEKIELMQPEGIIINDRLSINSEWYLQYIDWFEELQIPYYCNNQEFQLIEHDEFTFCLIDNTIEVSNSTLQKFATLLKENRQIVLVLSVEIDEDSSELYSLITESSSVVQILTVKEEQYDKEIIGEHVLQYATPVGENQIFNVIRIKGLKDKNE